ncbi:MFS transporter small subunit [Nocardioides fonticola]
MTTRLITAWGLVAVPIAYGLVETIRKASALFTG